MGKAFDAVVTGCDNSAKLGMMRWLGFDFVIDYAKEDFTRSGKTYDIILDVKTHRSIRHYLRALKQGGTYVTVGGAISLLLQTLLFLPFISIFSKKKVRIVVLKPNKDLEYINRLFTNGKIKPVIDGPFNLEQVPEAFRLFDKSLHKGKLVISLNSMQK